MHAGDEGNRGGTVQFYTKGLQSWLKGCDTRIEHIAKKGAPAGSTEQHTPRDCSVYAFCGSVLPHCVSNPYFLAEQQRARRNRKSPLPPLACTRYSVVAFYAVKDGMVQEFRDLFGAGGT